MKQSRLLLVAAFVVLCESVAMGQSAPTLLNPSFEQDHFSIAPGRILENGPITGWFSSSGTGINPLTNGSSPLADNGTVPDGRQVGFIQGSGSMVQSIGGFVPGNTYQLRFSENACEHCAGFPTVKAILGINTVVAEHQVSPVGGTNRYRVVASPPFVASDPNMDLAIINTSSNPDATVLLDNVRVIVLSTGAVNYTLIPTVA